MFCKLTGSVSSPWMDVRTLEASPAGLSNFTVEHREEGRALLLSWDEPRAPNGVIMVHNKITPRILKTVAKDTDVAEDRPFKDSPLYFPKSLISMCFKILYCVLSS